MSKLTFKYKSRKRLDKHGCDHRSLVLCWLALLSVGFFVGIRRFPVLFPLYSVCFLLVVVRSCRLLSVVSRRCFLRWLVLIVRAVFRGGSWLFPLFPAAVLRWLSVAQEGGKCMRVAATTPRYPL